VSPPATRVPFLDLRRQVEETRDAIDAAIEETLAAGTFVLGEPVERFESAFADFCGARDCIGVASGTDAITIALRAVGAQPGDEVVTVANTCVPTIVGIENAGCIPVLVDADPVTFTLDPARLEEAITPRTRAVVPVHLYGQCADLDPIIELARSRGLKVVEDCAQAHGAEYRGRPAGSLGDAAAFSFYPTKNLGALGDGGAVVTSDDDVAHAARLLRNYGEAERFHHVVRGWNSRLDTLQAAVLSVKLPLLAGWNERRRELAARYSEAFGDGPVAPPVEAASGGHVYHLYVVRVDNREAFRARLADRGIDTAVHYPVPVHRQEAYRALAPAGRSLAVSERLTETVVSLPLYPELTDAEAEAVIDAVSAV
jgi:dTDP-4-amino-4,6-dideoxygalactose transaminase